MKFRSDDGKVELEVIYSCGKKAYRSFHWALKAWGKTKKKPLLKLLITRVDGVVAECLLEIYLEAWGA